MSENPHAHWGTGASGSPEGGPGAHKSVGGLRASIYNAMPKEGVEALVEFLKKYEREHN